MQAGSETEKRRMIKYPRLSDIDLRRAIYFWWQKWNTAEIAHKIDVSEAAVANSIAAWREEQYQKRTAK